MKSCERMLTPHKLLEALTLLSELEGRATVISGGTDLIVAATKAPDAQIIKQNLISIKDIPELSEIYLREDAIHIGAACTLTNVIDSPMIEEFAPLLAAAAIRIASLQIRNAGTIGGNVMNASPAGDGLTALVCMGAWAVLGRRGEGGAEYRRLPVSQLVTGPRRTDRRDDELLVRLEIPKHEASVYRYEKVGLRSAMAISVASAAVLKEKSGGVHMALGSMGPRIVTSVRAEAAAKEGRIEEAVELMLAESSPIDDIRATARYRIAATRNILFRALREL